MPREHDPLEEVLARWLGSSTKLTVSSFLRANPGVVDTLEGFARRLAIPAERLAPEVDDLVAMGLLRERLAGGSHVYILDARKRAEIEERIVRSAGGRIR